MKLSWGFVLSSIYGSACAASTAKNGHVFVWDPPSTNDARPPTSTITPDTARLILAQRLGLSQFHSLGKASSEDVKLLNRFGRRSQELFGSDRERNNAHAFIWVDGVEDAAEALASAQPGSCQLVVSSPPATSANERLVDDILLQAEHSAKMADPSMKAYKSTLSMEAEMRSVAEEFGTTAYVYHDRLAILHIKQDGTHLASSVKQFMHKLQQEAESEGFSFTLVVMPPSTSHTKRSANPYGTYSLPSKKVSARREKEAPILSSPGAPETSQVAQNLSINNLEDFPKIQAVQTTQAPIGILPKCFESLSACQRRTNNCTGHGACYLAHKGEGGDCFSCQCKATILGSGDGKKTTNWGGPACQKKDIVVPFWLFVGSTVILMFLVGSGIGMLYTMGSEELPSVIGAGVSGPVKK